MISIKNSFLWNITTKRNILHHIKRYKSKKMTKKRTPMTIALDHFDDFYKSIFSEKWPSIRLALLSKEKKLAVINNFGDVTKTEKFCENLGAFSLKPFLELNQKQYLLDTETTISDLNKNVNYLNEGINEDKIKLQNEKKNLNVTSFGEKDLEYKEKYFSENSIKSEEDNIENSMTSMHSDMAEAEIQTDRLIYPDSGDANALLHMFVPATQLRGLENYIPESDYYKYYQTKIEQENKTESEFELNFPDTLKVYTFDRGDVTDFPEPTKCVNSVYNYLTVDGAELLTVLALGVESKDKVLCVSPYSGNMAFCIFQSLRPEILVCTNKKTVENAFNEYLYDYSPKWKGMLFLTEKKFEHLIEDPVESFDKILLEVPSTNDKRSLVSLKDNFFAVRNIKQRLTLPQKQAELLSSALKMVRPGGTVVYTTSTLSPIQNEGVVTEALKSLWVDNKMEFTVKDLSPALKHTSTCFNYGNYLKSKLGTLIVPFLPANYGPRYFCKIVRNKKNEESIEKNQE